MKSLKDIENMSLEHLEAVSLDETIVVPEDLMQKIQESLSRPAKRRVWMAGAAASIILLAGLGFGIARWQDEPKDTFDDPYLAYAELEKAFAIMSDGIRKGVSMAEESEAIIVRTTSVFSE